MTPSRKILRTRNMIRLNILKKGQSRMLALKRRPKEQILRGRRRRIFKSFLKLEIKMKDRGFQHRRL